MNYISLSVPLKVVVVVPFVIGIEGTTIVNFPPINVAVTSTVPIPVLTHAVDTPALFAVIYTSVFEVSEPDVG